MLWGLLTILGAGLVVWWAIMVAFTCWVLARPARRTYAFAVARSLPGDPSEVVVTLADGSARRGLEFTSWCFHSRGVNLPVWDVRGLAMGGPTIVLTHGWGDSRVVMLARVAALAPIAGRVVAWDLPAHGEAPRGRFTLGASEHEDLRALITALRIGGSHDGPGCAIVLHGFSFGAGVAIVAAGRVAARGEPLAGVIAEAPYRVPRVPAENVLRARGLPWRCNLPAAMGVLGIRCAGTPSWARRGRAGGFDRAEHAANLAGLMPLLVLHGTKDPICPVEDGRAIASAAGGRIVELACGHVDVWTNPASAERAREEVGAFLRRCAAGDQAIERSA